MFLYITGPAWLKYSKEQFVVTYHTGQQKDPISRPARLVKTIVLFGNVTISGYCYYQLFAKNIVVYFLSSKGKYLGVLNALQSTNIKNKYLQYKHFFDEQFRIRIAMDIVRGKITNQQRLLKRYQRTKKHNFGYEIGMLGNLISKLRQATTLDSLRWYEGKASAIYFEALGTKVFTGQLRFVERNQHPPLDPINSMLSFGYTLLAQTIFSALQTVWLDPYCGFMHSPKDNKPVLVLDMMEEWRSLVIDSLIIKMYNQWAITSDGFLFQKGGAYPVLLKIWLRDELIHQYQKRLKTEITHPVHSGKVTIFKALQLQGLQVIKTLQDQVWYEPYLFHY